MLRWAAREFHREDCHGRRPAPIKLTGWALVLGASSGFGAAASLALARAGLQHLRRAPRPEGHACPRPSASLADIEAAGREARFFNVNAADEERRAEVVGEMERVLTERGEMGQLRVILIHSLAFGTLKLFVAEPDEGRGDASRRWT